tara:strand:+ start:75 stop:980 length:906 start_codon:yes stop_codon:yes gene_type:complete
MFIQEELNRYCYWQIERENIRLQKEVSQLPPPWTSDSILREYKFCQVFREDDRTTRWFKTHIREPMKNSPDVLMATVIFRWFNWIPTGRTLIKHDLLKNWNRKKAIEEITKQPKWITGAYIIKTPNGMDKVTGVAECVSHMWQDREYLAKEIFKTKSLEDTWTLLRDYPYMGPFMAYEVVTDLRHTYLLEDAKDVLTWGNAGPGAMRGLNRLTGRELGYSKRSHDWVGEMQELYKIVQAKLPAHILQRNDMKYEMREIEGGLCEFDKYSRIFKGEGRTRSIYKQNSLPIVEDLINGESKYG